MFVQPLLGHILTCSSFDLSKIIQGPIKNTVNGNCFGPNPVCSDVDPVIYGCCVCTHTGRSTRLTWYSLLFPVNIHTHTQKYLHNWTHRASCIPLIHEPQAHTATQPQKHRHACSPHTLCCLHIHMEPHTVCTHPCMTTSHTLTLK